MINHLADRPMINGFSSPLSLSLGPGAVWDRREREALWCPGRSWKVVEQEGERSEAELSVLPQGFLSCAAYLTRLLWPPPPRAALGGRAQPRFYSRVG